MTVVAEHSPARTTAGDALLERYEFGDERDATDSFALAVDRWSVLAYQSAARTRTVEGLDFGRMTTFLRPYAKWYVYEHCLLAGRSVGHASRLLTALRTLDRCLDARSVASLDELASGDIMRSLWADLNDTGSERRRGGSYRRQLIRPFLRALRASFGLPSWLPPRARGARRAISELAADDSRIIPAPVIQQLTAHLAEHRDGARVLPSRDALLLAVLVLHIALGRRVSELLLTRRGRGDDGPFVSFAAADGLMALGFRFAPAKGGGADDVAYVSPEWEGVVRYCVSLILGFSDAARPFAAPEAGDLLILVWSGNATRSRGTANRGAGRARRPASCLDYLSFYHWLRGRPGSPGILERLHVTTTGKSNDPIYVMRTHSARHTRQSALMADANVSRLAAQRDLNTRSRDVQSIYQHGLAEQNASLVTKLDEGVLVGTGAAWLRSVRGGFEPGDPRRMEMDPRIRGLISASPAFLEFNRVPAGYCVRPQGPAACPEFLACLEAAEEGCDWFATDPSDSALVEEIRSRARSRREEVHRAAGVGQVVLAGKLAVLAARAEAMADRVATPTAGAVERLRVHVERRSTEESA